MSFSEIERSIIKKYRKELMEAHPVRDDSADFTTDIDITNTDGLLNNAPFGNDHYMRGENRVIWYGTAAGLVFGIFAMLLCGYLMSSSLALKKRNYGVLRSLGAGEADVKRIMLFELLLLSACIFIMGLAFTLIGYYAFLEPLFYVDMFKICILQLNGWNILILLALSFLVPLLCTVMPLRRFLKKPIVDNITGNREKK